MRPWSLILLLLGCAGCFVRVPQPRGIGVSLNATVRANARVEVPLPPPPPAPPPPVALQGAPVVEFFGIPLEGAQDVVFVLDCSGSMTDPAQGAIAKLGGPGGPAGPADPSQPPGPPDPSLPAEPPDPAQPAPPESEPPPAAELRKIDVAREELADAIARLPAGTPMNVIFFNSGVEAFAPGMVPLEESGRDGLIGFVRSMTAAGSTALAPAMRIAFLMNARRIVLLSDGMGNVGGDARSLLRDAREAIRGGVRIDTIGLGQHQDAALLKALARESGGIYQAL
jgi:hypothetical protein